MLEESPCIDGLNFWHRSLLIIHLNKFPFILLFVFNFHFLPIMIILYGVLANDFLTAILLNVSLRIFILIFILIDIWIFILYYSSLTEFHFQRFLLFFLFPYQKLLLGEKLFPNLLEFLSDILFIFLDLWHLFRYLLRRIIMNPYNSFLTFIDFSHFKWLRIN